MPAVSDACCEPRALSAGEAAAWRARHRQIGLWQLLAWQALAGAATAALAALLAQELRALYAAAWGAASVLLPAMLFAHALRHPAPSAHAALLRLFVWEFVKLGLGVAMLLAGAKLLPQPHWPALLAGLVVTSKAQWLALCVRRNGVPST